MDQRELLATSPRPLPDHQMDRLLMRCNLQGEAIRTRREQNESNRTCHDLIYDTTSEAKSKDKHTLTTKQRTHGEQSDLTSGSSSHSLTPIPLLFFSPLSLVLVFMQALGTGWPNPRVVINYRIRPLLLAGVS